MGRLQTLKTHTQKLNILLTFNLQGFFTPKLINSRFKKSVCRYCVIYFKPWFFFSIRNVLQDKEINTLNVVKVDVEFFIVII